MDKNMQSANTTKMSLSDATKPLLVVSRLVGLNPKSRWHKIYTVCILVYEITIVFCVWQYYSSTVKQYAYFNGIVHGVEDACRVTWLLVTLGLGLFDQTRFMVPLKDFARVDQGLKTLNGFIDNRETYRFQISLGIYVGILLLLFGLVEFISFALLMPNNHWNIIFSLSWSYNMIMIIVGAVVDNCFSSTVSVIRQRFKEINWIIHRARQYGVYSRVDILEVSRAHLGSDVLRDLRILRRQYHDLWEIAYRVNEAYDLHFLVGTMTSMTLITSNLWTSYSVLTNFDRNDRHVVVKGIIVAVLYVARLFILVKASEGTVVEAKAISGALQELGIEGDYDRATKDEIRDFLSQLQLEARKFTACGFFDIDFSLIVGILGAVFTYLVILIQISDRDSCAISDYSNKSVYFEDEVNS